MTFQSQGAYEPTDESLLLCRDCGIDAWGMTEDGRIVHEDFYVSNNLWDAVCPDDNVRRYVEDGAEFGDGNFVICIGCFERRLGRKLTREDLRVEPGPLFGRPPSGRFRDRWGH